MVVNAGIVSAVRGALLDISALPIPLSIIVIPRGNLTVKELSEEYGVSTRTIYRKLTKSYKEELPNLLIRPVVVLMDATYWGRNFGVVIFMDATTHKVLHYRFLRGKERISDYQAGIPVFKIKDLQSEPL